MPVIDLRDAALRVACRDAVLEVLETMFFELPADDALPVEKPSEGANAGTVRFGGSLQGTLCVAVSSNCPRRLAAGFLGLEEEEIGDAEEQSMIVELANVLCGATMSRVEPAGRLRIGQPVLGAPLENCPGPWLRFPLESGSVEVTVHFGEEQ